MSAAPCSTARLVALAHGGTPQKRLGLLPAAQEYVLTQDNGKDRCLQVVRELSQAFVLSVSTTPWRPTTARCR